MQRTSIAKHDITNTCTCSHSRQHDHFLKTSQNFTDLILLIHCVVWWRVATKVVNFILSSNHVINLYCYIGIVDPIRAYT